MTAAILISGETGVVILDESTVSLGPRMEDRMTLAFDARLTIGYLLLKICWLTALFWLVFQPLISEQTSFSIRVWQSSGLKC